MRYARVKFVPGNRVHEKRVLTSAIIDLVEQGQDLGFGLWVHRRRGILRRRAAPQRRGLNHNDPSQNQRRQASTDHVGERPVYAGNKENGNKEI